MPDSVSTQDAYFEEQGQGFDSAYVIGLLKRRILYFAIPFLIIALVGLAVTELQQPIYRADSKLLLESSTISAALLQSTNGGIASEQFEVFKERILAPESLLAAVDKFNLFPGVRDRMSGYQLIELMRKRIEIKPTLSEMQPNRSTAFAISFNYEVPSVALKVVNEFVTKILSEDTANRTANAAQTTQILEDQVNSLKSEYDEVSGQIAALKQRPLDQQETVPEETKSQIHSLAMLEADLAEKSSVYSDEHPVIKKLKKDIAALKRIISIAPQGKAVGATTGPISSQALELRATFLAKGLDDARDKLAAARLGESLERNQQGEHLQVIQHPEVEVKPVSPAKLKWLMASLALAAVIGGAIAFAAEMLDSTIRSRQELATIIDRRLIVSIPYIFIPGEQRRRRLKFALVWTALFAIVVTSGFAIMELKPTGVNFARVGPVMD